jgi:flagellar hook-associated protein 2
MGIQISGLLSNQAFDWKSVVDQLIAVDTIPITTLQKEQATNTDKISALGQVSTALQDLQDNLQSIRSSSVFTSRAVTSDNTTTTWKSTSAAGAPVGTYKFAIQQLATAANITGASNIGAGLAPTSNVTGVTLANMNTATAVTAGKFTVNGVEITIATTDTLNDVFTKIATATGNVVTGAYTPSTTNPNPDTITLTSSSGTLMLGAATDTSNFLQVMKLGNGGAGSSTSSGPLGIVKTSATLVNSALVTTPTGDVSGNGSFTINNVPITYNVNTDSLSAVLARINASTAGVTAAYDAASDRVVLTNKNTGDTGINIAETTGNLLTALGLTTAAGSTFNLGKNAQFTVNGGPTLTSTSNTLDATVHGITGLSVTVNTQTTQTLTVESDTGTMQTAIQGFLDKFNAVQDTIEAKTKITTGAGTVSTSILSDNREIQSWARQLQQLAFNTVSGVTGSITKLDDLGIDFDGTSGHLLIKNQAKLSTALSDKPADVQSYFVSGSSGMVPTMYGVLTTLIASDHSQQDNISQANTDLGDQITTLQSRLADERTKLTNSFISMLDAQSAAQSQNTALTNAFFRNNSN